MAWIVGIDEAGYGPNIGPFVMTAVGCKVPDALAAADLWDVLKGATRRHDDSADERIIVADSKLVYSSTRGLAELEHSVLAFLHGTSLETLSQFIDRMCPTCRDEIKAESWYYGTTTIPVKADTQNCSRAGKALREACEDRQVRWDYVTSAVVCPASFNQVLDKWQTKGAVLGRCLIELLRGLPRDDEPVFVAVDKHGGRNTYSALLQPAFADGLVLAHSEGRDNSVYEVSDGGRTVTITIQPRADTNHFCVALASMLSKYLRELLMIELNQFWQQKVPGLKATAGYPTDASRFWQQILPAVKRLGIAEDAVWRRR